MRIDIGFNPSCSEQTFTLTGHTTAKLALAMYDIINDDWKKSYKKPHPCYKKVSKWLKNHKDYDKSIYLPWSCNYESWLYKDGDTIEVNTCNNDPWEDMDLDICIGGDECYTIPDNAMFLDLRDLKEKTVEEIKIEERERLNKLIGKKK